MRMGLKDQLLNTFHCTEPLDDVKTRVNYLWNSV